MPQLKKASKYETQQCEEILSEIDDFIPETGFTQIIQERLREQGYDVSRERISNARRLRVKDLRIMRELQEWVKELYPFEFSKIETGLSK
ncbi:MAG: hypothetical protein ACFB2Y_09675 [Fulvivirga sp.]